MGPLRTQIIVVCKGGAARQPARAEFVRIHTSEVLEEGVKVACARNRTVRASAARATVPHTNGVAIPQRPPTHDGRRACSRPPQHACCHPLRYGHARASRFGRRCCHTGCHLERALRSAHAGGRARTFLGCLVYNTRLLEKVCLHRRRREAAGAREVEQHQLACSAAGYGQRRQQGQACRMRSGGDGAKAVQGGGWRQGSGVFAYRSARSCRCAQSLRSRKTP